MGRRKHGPDEGRRAHVDLRLTRQEYADLSAAAATAGRTITDMLRLGVGLAPARRPGIGGPRSEPLLVDGVPLVESPAVQFECPVCQHGSDRGIYTVTSVPDTVSPELAHYLRQVLG